MTHITKGEIYSNFKLSAAKKVNGILYFLSQLYIYHERYSPVTV